MISVVVPVFNAAKYLNKCVDSLCNQTYLNIEIVLVDDGSTDESPKLCDEYSSKDARIKVVHKPNGGLVSAWKAGVDSASGEYVSFVDSDDWVDANMLEEMFEVSSKGKKSEIISSDYIIERINSFKNEDENAEYMQEYVYQTLPPGEYDKGVIEKKIIPNLLGNEKRLITISRCMKLFSTELIRNNMKYPDESIGMAEDMTITIPAIFDADRIVVMDHKAYYHYLFVNESMVHKYDKKAYSSIEKTVNAIKKVIDDRGANPDLLKSLDREHIFLLLLALKNEARGNPEGYRANIRQICKDHEELIKNTDVIISELSNKLLYRALKKPSALNLSVLWAAMIVYYLKARK